MYDLAYGIWASGSLKILNNDNLVQIRQSAGLDALNLEIVTLTVQYVKCCIYKASPGPVDGDELLNGLGLDEGAGVFRAVSDNLMDGVEDGDHSVLLQVFGWPLLTAGQVAHQVPHGITSCKVKCFLKVNQVIVLGL